MPSPVLRSTRSLLLAFGYDEVDTMSAEAIRQQARRLREKHKLKVKHFGKRIGFRYYQASIDAALASQPDHQFA